MELLSRLGARIGNANDEAGYRRGHTAATLRDAGRRWRTIDRLAGWLYTLPERGRP